MSKLKALMSKMVMLAVLLPAVVGCVSAGEQSGPQDKTASGNAPAAPATPPSDAVSVGDILWMVVKSFL